MFKCGDHYVSLSDIEVVLRTGRKPILLYCNTEDIINFVKRTLRYVEIDFDNIVKEKTKQGIRND
jgi:sporulation protein YlmC with PRC-barrel domain